MKKFWKKEQPGQPDPADQDQPEVKKGLFTKKTKPVKDKNPRKKDKPVKEKPVKPAKEKKQPKERPPKSQEYIIRKNFTMKILRAVFWLLVLFIFFKGVQVSIRPDPTDQVRGIIRSFKTELAFEKDKNEEIFGFTQNFVKEYLTYSKEGGESDFKSRLSPYVHITKFHTANAYDFRKNAKAVYVQAYRKEHYTDTQYDVFVLAEIMYTDRVLNEKSGEYEIVTEYETSILKVPVAASADNKYCVESIPMFVQDQLLDYSYAFKDYFPEGKIDNSKVQSSIENFLTAYYSQDQEVINYYLFPEADKTRFLSLNNRYQFVKVDDLKAFQVGNEIVCVIKIRIKDSANEAIIYQEFHITCIEEKDRVYIKDINTRANNIKE